MLFTQTRMYYHRNGLLGTEEEMILNVRAMRYDKIVIVPCYHPFKLSITAVSGWRHEEAPQFEVGHIPWGQGNALLQG